MHSQITIIIIIILIIICLYFIYHHHHATKNEYFSTNNNLTCDILIVGAGASGIYSAWRLSHEYPNKKIIIVEKSDRISGRLESIPFGNPDIYAEMGGMRTFPGIDIYLTKLLNVLNIQSIPIPYIEPDNIGFVRGHRYNLNVLDSSSNRTIDRQQLITTYKLPPNEYNISINDIILNAAEKSAPYFHSQWRTMYHSNYLNNTTFVNMLKNNNVSNGAIEAYRDFGGYNFSFDVPIAASTGIRENLSLSGMTQQHFVVGGYDSFIRKMAQEIILNPNITLLLNTSLEKIQPQREINYCQIKTSNNINFMINARQVILAAARDSLIQIDAPWTSEAMEAMVNINSWSAFKAFMLVDDKTYNILSKNGSNKGRCVSDLPARQVWMYSDNPPTILVYADDSDADYWSQFITSQQDRPRFVDPNINVNLTNELIRQISVIFGVDPTLININEIMYKYWDAGAYFWRPSNIDRLMSAIIQPFGNHINIFVVGSDFSYSQGWVEGAIESADAMLVKYFGLPSFV
ncbi:amine oxidoreductase [Moumouvirus goulette]|uniref:Amine oxidoreductase n=1 Tax=Moumouvirus goulette TaxID=1247379 RepID=M1NNK7_9VIRU|nr:amine oxidoreductase [Moumouvirus goulette]AGF85645.1 amine oxidoreductase [Moumouvirus goulette]